MNIIMIMIMNMMDDYDNYNDDYDDDKFDGDDIIMILWLVQLSLEALLLRT